MAPDPFAKAQMLARISAELIRYRAPIALFIAAKALLARELWGIDATSFLMLGLHDQRMGRWAESMRYMRELEPGLRTINWQGDGKRLTVDKLITAERLAQAGIASAPLIAVIGRDGAAHPHAGLFPLWSSAEDVAAGLAACPARLFVKPANGWRGDGVLGPERRERGWHVDGTTVSDRELAQRLLAQAPPVGSLLQERICSHRGLTPIGGDLGLSTVRINTALTADGPEVIFVFAKIMGSKGLVDNFSGGKFGNMLARVDKESGRLTHVFGRKREQRFLMNPVTEHPLTGIPLVGFQLPLWTEAVALAKRLAVSCPEAPLIGADVAITDRGPLIIEIQSDWDANAAQLTMGQGLRPVLRDVVPRLALSKELKEQAIRQMGLSGRARRQERFQRQPRF